MFKLYADAIHSLFVRKKQSHPASPDNRSVKEI